MSTFIDFDEDDDNVAAAHNETSEERMAFDQELGSALERSWAGHSENTKAENKTERESDGSIAVGGAEKRGRARQMAAPLESDPADALKDPSISSAIRQNKMSPRPPMQPSQTTNVTIIRSPVRNGPIRVTRTLPNPIKSNAEASSSKSAPIVLDHSESPPELIPFVETPPPKEMLKICKAWDKFQKDEKKKPTKVISSLLLGKVICVVMSFNAVNILATKWKLLHEHSAVVSLRYSPTVTHILVESSLGPSGLFKFVGVKRVDELRRGIEILTWDWYTRSKKLGLQSPAKHQYFPDPKTNPTSGAGSSLVLKRKSTTDGMEVPGVSKRSKAAQAQTRYDPTDSDTSQSLRYPPPPGRGDKNNGMDQDDDDDDDAMTSPEKSTHPDREQAEEGDTDAPHSSDKQAGVDVKERWRIAKPDEADGLDWMIDGVRSGAVTEGRDGEMVETPGFVRAGSGSTPVVDTSDVESDGDGTEDEVDLTKEKEIKGRTRARIEAARASRQPQPGQDGPYKCQQDSDGNGSGCPNEDIAVALEKLGKIYANSRDKNTFQKRAYVKAASKLRTLTYRIKSREMALEIKGLGGGMADRIGEYLVHGKTLREGYEDTEQSRAVAAFGKIYGIGSERANQLWEAGAKSLNDLRTKNFGLSDGQKLGLEYYDDLNTRIPREEVTALFKIIETEAHKLDSKLIIDPMGSYRRGEANSGDLDILISHDPSDGITHAGLVKKLVNNLCGMGVTRHCVSEPRDWNSLEAKWMGTGKVNDHGLLRRIDILCIPYEQYGAALIYFTGNDHFNRSLRLYANKHGFSLNQRGLYKGVCRDPKTRLKTTEGTLVAAAREQDIFDALGIRYRPPHLRRP